MVTREELQQRREDTIRFYDEAIARSELARKENPKFDNVSNLQERKNDNLRKIAEDEKALERAERQGISFEEAKRDLRKKQFRKQANNLEGEEKKAFDEQREEVRARTYLSSRPVSRQDPALREEARRVISERERRDASRVALGTNRGPVVLSEKGAREVNRFRQGQANRSREVLPYVSASPSIEQPARVLSSSDKTPEGFYNFGQASNPRDSLPPAVLQEQKLGFYQKSGLSRTVEGFRAGFFNDFQSQYSLGGSRSGGNAAVTLGQFAQIPAIGGTAFGAGVTFSKIGSLGAVPLIASIYPASYIAGKGVAQVDVERNRGSIRNEGLTVDEFRAGRSEALNRGNFLGQINPAFIPKQDYVEGFREGSGRAVSSELALSSRRTTAKTEAFVLVLPGVSSEVKGSQLISRMGEVKGTFGGVLRKSSIQIGKVGAIEGSSQYVIQQTGRDQRINPTEFALAGGVGAITAGVLGGSIVAFGATGAKKTSRALNIGANILDPTEYPGDRIAYASGRVPQVFVKTPTPSPSFIFSQTSNSRPSARDSFRATIPVSTTDPYTKSNPSINPFVPTTTQQPISPTPVPVPNPVPSPASTRTSTPVPVPVPVKTNTPVTPFVPTTTKQPINPFVPVSVSSSKFPLFPFGPSVGKFLGSSSNKGFSSYLKAQYTPSLFAQTFGITSKKRPKGSFTGFELRPIYTGRGA